MTCAIYRCVDDEIVPTPLRSYLRWTSDHQIVAHKIMRDYGLKLPTDRELIRHLAYLRVQHRAFLVQPEDVSLDQARAASS
jgi:hypothetical protein